MKHRLESYVSSTSFQPWPAYAFTHLQESYTECIDAIMKCLSFDYDPTVPYKLYGFEVVNIGGFDTVSEGAVFFNGEIYLHSFQSVPLFPGVLVADVFESFADPVGQTVYTDTTINKDCQILTCKFRYGTSGTGTIGDLSDFVEINPSFTSNGIVMGAGWTNVGAPNNLVGYKVDGNEVSLCGTVQSSTVAPGGITAFTLPAIARPAKEIQIPTIFNGATVETALLKVLTNGNVGGLTGLTGDCQMFLDGIRFRKS